MNRCSSEAETRAKSCIQTSFLVVVLVFVLFVAFCGVWGAYMVLVFVIGGHNSNMIVTYDSVEFVLRTDDLAVIFIFGSRLESRATCAQQKLRV